MPNDLVQRVEALERKLAEFQSPAQLDPLIQQAILDIVGNIRLSDLLDVEGTDSASTGQVLKKTATTWQPGTDEIGTA